MPPNEAPVTRWSREPLPSEELNASRHFDVMREIGSPALVPAEELKPSDPTALGWSGDCDEAEGQPLDPTLRVAYSQGPLDLLREKQRFPVDD